MIGTLLDGPFWVVDMLPEQVPKDCPGQYFAVEAYYLQPSRLADIHRRFTDILLKLNCYYDFRIFLSGEEQAVCNPVPEQLVSWISPEGKDLSIVLPGENALITLNHDDTHMTVYSPSEILLNRMERLASAEGLFLWKPKQGSPGQPENCE